LGDAVRKKGKLDALLVVVFLLISVLWEGRPDAVVNKPAALMAVWLASTKVVKKLV